VLVCVAPPPAPGISDRHAFEALSNAGVFLSSRGSVSCPLLVGSGKSETPCERRQRANFAASAATPAGGLGAPESAPAETAEGPTVPAPWVGVLVVEGDEPPQAASQSAALAAIAAATIPARGFLDGAGVRVM
jgi:hypothetical protein